MEEIQVLATLIQHADKQIDVSMNMFLVVLGVMATFTMTEAYEKKFNVFLKIMMSVILTVVFWGNRESIIEQMYIYNALVESFPDGIEPWKTLFGDHSVYHLLNPDRMYWLHAVMSSLVHLFIWHRELSLKVGAPIKLWLRNWKIRRRRG